MSASVRKFIARPPRYTLRPDDDHYIRYAHQEDTGKTHTTKFIDISMTGLAFVTDRDQAPFLFDTIKIEVPLGDGQQIAWWAKVVRVEEYAPLKWFAKNEESENPFKVLVAVEFNALPIGHVNKIKDSLGKKFERVQKEKRTEALKDFSFLIRNHWVKLLVYAVCTVLTFYILWALSRPSENYDAQRGAPWGERYPQFNIFSN